MSAAPLDRNTIHKLDGETLLINEKFCRWLFTILSSAGILEGYFHSVDGVLAYGEGRRSLGLDMLTDLAVATRTSKEEVLQALLSAEIKTQKEVQSVRRNRSYNANRNAELGGPDDDDDGGTED